MVLRKRPLQHPQQTCEALTQEAVAVQPAGRKLICYTRHLERTASGLGSEEESPRIYYHEVLALSEMAGVIGSVKEIVLDLGVAYSQMYAPQSIEWDAVIGAIRRGCQPDAIIKVAVTFDWTMVGAADRFTVSFEVGRPINIKPADIQLAAASSAGSGKLPFLAGYILLRRLIGDLKDFEGEREALESLQP